MTQREFFNAVVNANISEEISEHAKKQIAAIDKRNATPTKAEIEKQASNDRLKAMIMGVLSASEMPMTAAAIGVACEVSTAKASSMLRQLVEVGSVEKSEVKVKGEGKKTVYAAVAAEEEEGD